MVTGNLVLVSILACIVLAALGARIAKALPWKGAVSAGAYLAAFFFASLFTDSIILMLAAGIIAVGIISGPMSLKTSNQ